MEFVQSHKIVPVELVYDTGSSAQTIKKLLITCLFHQLTIIRIKSDIIFLLWVFVSEKSGITDYALLQAMLHIHFNLYKSSHQNSILDGIIQFTLHSAIITTC